jgi:riboflavin synthase
VFTGIVEERGSIAGIKKGAHSAVLTIRAGKVLENTKIGDSIAVNGVCLTVTDFTADSFNADVMHETLNRSSLSGAKPGTHVNLERAMPADGRFGGHIVAGHVDGVGTIKTITKDDNAIIFDIAADEAILRYIVEKGSITVDGISLTVASVSAGSFTVSVIPHTAKETTLGEKKTGDPVNLENDIIGKYVEKLLFSEASTGKEQPAKTTITEAFLLENGF